MANPISGVVEPGRDIYQKIGEVASQWGWVEMLLGEMLSHYCRADTGAMYVITQSTSAATITNWLRTLTHIKVKDGDSLAVILDLLTDVDHARAQRNTIVHGLWRAADEPGFATVQTFDWERKEVVRTELWSVHDLDDVIHEIGKVQLMLGNLGVRMGFMQPDP